MKTTSLFIFAAMAIMFSGLFSALVVSAEKDIEKRFNELDTDKNHSIDVSEAENNTLLFREFDNIDKDGNKKLDMSEFSAFEPIESYTPPDLDQHEPGAAPLD